MHGATERGRHLLPGARAPGTWRRRLVRAACLPAEPRDCAHGTHGGGRGKGCCAPCTAAHAWTGSGHVTPNPGSWRGHVAPPPSFPSPGCGPCHPETHVLSNHRQGRVETPAKGRKDRPRSPRQLGARSLLTAGVTESQRRFERIQQKTADGTAGTTGSTGTRWQGREGSLGTEVWASVESEID